jgi:hypothetical protein
MKIIQWLTFSVCGLACIASVGGILIPSLYRDGEIYKAAWQANDIITILVTPAILVSFNLVLKGNLRAYLIWLGLILYMFYNYAFYLFGAKFNLFFPIYVLLFVLSLYAILIGLYKIKIDNIPSEPLRNRKYIAAFLILISGILAVVEFSQYLNFAFNGYDPKIPTLILSLDLSLVIPNCLLAAVLLLLNNPWGKVLSAMMLVKSLTYGLVLMSGTTLIAVRNLGDIDPLLPFYAFVALGGFVFGWMLLKTLGVAQNILIKAI